MTIKKITTYKFAIALLGVSLSVLAPISYAQNPSKGRCTATTQQGTRCKNGALKNGRCHIHQTIDE